MERTLRVVGKPQNPWLCLGYLAPWRFKPLRNRKRLRAMSPLGLALIVLALGAVVAAFTVKSLWLRVVPAALVLGPLSYGLLGVGLARFAPPGRIAFLSLPLSRNYVELNIALWVVLWGALLTWFWHRRRRRPRALDVKQGD